MTSTSTMTQQSSIFNITNDANNSYTTFINKDANGVSQNILEIGATGIKNYVPYVPTNTSSVPSSLLHMGGCSYSTGAVVTGVSLNDNVFAEAHRITLNIGVYLLIGHIKIYSGSATLDFSANSSSIITGFSNTSASSPSYINTNYIGNVKFITITTSGEFNTGCSIIVNITTNNTILYYNRRIYNNTTVTYSIVGDISATRIG